MSSIITQKIFIVLFLSSIGIGCGNKNINNGKEEMTEKTSESLKKIKIILGSTREQSMSKKFGLAFKKIADKKTSISTEIIDLTDYALPFLYEQIAPMQRTEIKDIKIQKWSDTISDADAFIVIVPEYNSGYPGVLKNALDLLYKEWNNKPVILVGHSGGPSGGKNALNQLEQVLRTLKMNPINPKVLIPTSWKALNPNGSLVEKEQENSFDTALDEMINILTKSES